MAARSGPDPRAEQSDTQFCRHCNAGVALEAHVCPSCGRLLALARGLDYFRFFGLPRKLTIDAQELERRFRTLSRQFHPDYFYKAPALERRASLERASYLNDAYRALKSPTARAEYLLSIEGLATKSSGEASARVPPALLEEVFALNEELDEVRSLRQRGAPAAELHARLERARQPIERKREEHERDLAALSSRWDRLVDEGADASTRRGALEALRDRLLERNYINNLLATIAREEEMI